MNASSVARRLSRHLDRRRVALLVVAGVLVTFVAAVWLVVDAFDHQGDDLAANRQGLARASRERGELSRKLDEAMATNERLQTQVADLTDEVEALRAQLIAAGVQPMVTPVQSPPTTTTTAAPPAAPPPPPSPPPPTTRPPLVCVLNVCIGGPP